MTQSAEKTVFIGCNEARQIMEENFLDPQAVFEEIKKRHHGIIIEAPSNEFEKIPISEEELLEYKESHILVPGLELCLQDFYSLSIFDLGFSLEDAWYLNMSFAKERTDRTWFLVKKSVVRGSIGETYPVMQQRLKPGEEIPRACELFYAVIFYCIFSERVHLYRGSYPICRDIVREDYRPHVGFFGPELGVRFFAKNTPDPRIGLAPIRKLIVP